jgi:hypothetical protein
MSGWFCDCCHYDTPPCDYCSADADTVAMTLAGFGDLGCDCSAWNGTYILTRRPSNACVWEAYMAPRECPGFGTISGRMTAHVMSLYGQYRWFADLTLNYYLILYAELRWTWGSGGGVPFDCTAHRALTAHSLYERTPGLCYWGSVTCELN